MTKILRLAGVVTFLFFVFVYFQVQRRKWKLDLIAQLASRITADPVPLTLEYGNRDGLLCTEH